MLVGLGVVLEPGVAKNSALLLKIWLELVLDNQVSCRLITAIILGCRTHILNIRVILVGVSRASIGEIDKLMLWLVLRLQIFGVTIDRSLFDPVVLNDWVTLLKRLRLAGRGAIHSCVLLLILF